MVATTLTVVSCLHRHASLDSMREVETVQPLAYPPTFGRTTNDTRFLTTTAVTIIPTARRRELVRSCSSGARRCAPRPLDHRRTRRRRRRCPVARPLAG